MISYWKPIVIVSTVGTDCLLAPTFGDTCLLELTVIQSPIFLYPSLKLFAYWKQTASMLEPTISTTFLLELTVLQLCYNRLLELLQQIKNL